MAEAAAKPADDAAAKGGAKDGAKPSAGKGGKLTKILALVFMLTVIATESLVGYLWFFAPSQSAVGAAESDDDADASKDEGHGKKAAGHGKEKGHGKKSEHGDKGEHGKSGHGEKPAHGEAEKSESGHGSGGHGEEAAAPKPIGDFVEFDLGKFSVMAFQPGANAMRVIEFHLFGTVMAEDSDEFDLLWAENKQRCRDQVIVTIRSAEVEDFTDPALGLIKRKILARTNDVLGKPLVEEVMFSDFSFIEE